MLKAWLRFFRVVNLPTVPGDVLVGAGTMIYGIVNARRTVAYDVSAGLRLAFIAALASVFFYMYGLADNDIVGAKKDEGRPIPRGDISLGAARLARGLCLFAAMIVGIVGNLPPDWWIVAFALTLAIILYNRTKWPAMMGLCRALNVACGVAALVVSWSGRNDIPVGTDTDLIVSAIFWLSAVFSWWLYITQVTIYSEGEETDPIKRRRVGFLIGAIIYLQLLALLFVGIRPFLLAGAGLLVLLRLMKRFLPGVSAS